MDIFPSVAPSCPMHWVRRSCAARGNNHI
jgi:hypothetical protein